MTTEQTVKVRLVHVRYDNHLEWEDGPGSLTNVVSKSSRPQAYDMFTMTMTEAQALDRHEVEEIVGFELDADSADGFEEHSYKLEWFDPTKDKWRMVKFFH